MKNRNRKCIKDWMQILVFSEAVGYLPSSNYMHWIWHVLRRRKVKGHLTLTWKG